jgi:hypothetical protein
MKEMIQLYQSLVPLSKAPYLRYRIFRIQLSGDPGAKRRNSSAKPLQKNKAAIPSSVSLLLI